MKILKNLSTLLVIMGVVLGTTVLAESPSYNGLSYDGSANTITFSVDVSRDSLSAYTCIGILFDGDKFEYVSHEAIDGVSVQDYGDGEMEIYTESAVDTSSSKTIATITLNVIADDKSTVVGSEFDFACDWNDGSDEAKDTVAVTAAGGNQGGDVDLTTPKAGAEITVNEGTLAGKKVVVTTYEGIANSITENTKVKITYDGNTSKESDPIFEELKVQGGGTITTGKIVFGVVCSTELDASKFTFALVD